MTDFTSRPARIPPRNGQRKRAIRSEAERRTRAVLECATRNRLRTTAELEAAERAIMEHNHDDALWVRQQVLAGNLREVRSYL